MFLAIPGFFTAYVDSVRFFLRSQPLAHQFWGELGEGHAEQPLLFSPQGQREIGADLRAGEAGLAEQAM